MEMCSESGYGVVDGVGGTYGVFEGRNTSGVRVGEGGRKGCPLTTSNSMIILKMESHGSIRRVFSKNR